MKFTDWQKNWEALGDNDPLWVILTNPEKKGGRWSPDEFFQTGRTEIEELLATLEQRGVGMARNVALDFGCGVGRLTQALAPHFREVHGVDISSSMIRHANSFNQYQSHCHYHVNPQPELALFASGTIDLIYTNIVLQHIMPKDSVAYLREFVRLLTPSGIAVFQILVPTFRRRLFPQFLVDALRRYRHGNEPHFGMFGIPYKVITNLLESLPIKVLWVEDVTSADLGWRWISLRYCIRKEATN
ncbi:methyltransferase domain-containing protein [bacterium]|nr:methyltransferase domain-containing protein [bacterium]